MKFLTLIINYILKGMAEVFKFFCATDRDTGQKLGAPNSIPGDKRWQWLICHNLALICSALVGGPNKLARCRCLDGHRNFRPLCWRSTIGQTSSIRL